MKKISILFMLLFLIFMLTACKQSERTFSDNIIEKPSSESIATDTLYNKFLSKKINALDKNGNTITLDEYFNDESKNTYHQYAIYDMNGDDIPELIIRTVKGLDIFWIKNDKVTLWYQGTNYAKPLNNKAILYERPGGAPKHTDYQYIVLDYTGEEVLKISFSEYYGGDDPSLLEHFDSSELYLINQQEVTKAIYEDLCKTPILSIADDAIEWKDIPLTEN